MVRRRQSLLGGNHQTIARHAGDRFAEDRLGSIVLRGIEKVDAEIKRLLDQRHGIVRRLRVVAHAEPARPAAAKAGDAHS